MRSNSYAKYIAPSKFEGNQRYVENASNEGNRLRARLEGKRILFDDHSTTQMAHAFKEARHG